MYTYLTDALMIDSSTFYTVPYSDDVKHMFLYAWSIAYGPILLQQALLVLKEEHSINELTFSDTNHINLLFRSLTALFNIGHADLLKALNVQEPHTNVFTIDHNWTRPDNHLPKNDFNPHLQLRREDPLPFPEEAPPGIRTHFHGRWA